MRRYSITSSARVSMFGGTLILCARAALILKASLYLVGSWMKLSAGSITQNTDQHIFCDVPKVFLKIYGVRNKATCLYRLGSSINRRQAVL